MPSTLIVTKCPKCGQRIEIAGAGKSPAASVFGGLIVRCDSCRHISALYVGIGVDMAKVHVGAEELAIYDEDAEFQKDHLLAHFRAALS